MLLDELTSPAEEDDELSLDELDTGNELELDEKSELLENILTSVVRDTPV